MQNRTCISGVFGPCRGPADVDQTKSKHRRRSTTLLSFDALSTTNPREYPHKPKVSRKNYLRSSFSRMCRKKNRCNTFLLLTLWVTVYLHSNFGSGLRKTHLCNITEHTVAVQGHLRSYISVAHKSTARTKLPIFNQQQPWSYLAPFRRYGGLNVEIAKLYLSLSHLVPWLKANLSIFEMNLKQHKLESLR